MLILQQTVMIDENYFRYEFKRVNSLLTGGMMKGIFISESTPFNYFNLTLINFA
jgi:hypothetical protein